MQALEVPQSASMQGYLAAEDWQNAYKVDILLLIKFPNRSLCSTAALFPLFQQAILDSAAVVQAANQPNTASFISSTILI